MSNVGRVLTLVIKITDDKLASRIWENHLNPHLNNCFGFDVNKIHEGNAIAELNEELDKALEGDDL